MKLLASDYRIETLNGQVTSVSAEFDVLSAGPGIHDLIKELLKNAVAVVENQTNGDKLRFKLSLVPAPVAPKVKGNVNARKVREAAPDDGNSGTSPGEPVQGEPGGAPNDAPATS